MTSPNALGRRSTVTAFGSTKRVARANYDTCPSRTFERTDELHPYEKELEELMDDIDPLVPPVLKGHLLIEVS